MVQNDLLLRLEHVGETDHMTTCDMINKNEFLNRRGYQTKDLQPGNI